MIQDFLQYIFDRVWSTYCSAMQEQMSIIVSILTTLLTGGFLMLFIENQHLGSKVTENYHAIMDPFMRKFSGYVRFIESVKAWCVVNKSAAKESYVKEFKELLDKLGREGSKSIMSGRDIPISHYSPDEFTNMCESMNSIWYCWDTNCMMKEFKFDAQRADQFDKISRQYLNEAMPYIYDNQEISMSLIVDVSSKMYCDFYQPIKDCPYHYQFWQEKEQSFNRLTVTVILVNLGILALILLCRYFLPIWIFTLLTIASMSLLGYAIYKLLELIDLSKRLFR